MASNNVSMPNISQIKLYIEAVQKSQNPSSNQSTITCKAYLYNSQQNYYYNWPNCLEISILVDNISVASQYVNSYDFRPAANRQQGLLTKDYVVTHGADGKKTVTVTAKFTACAAHPGPGSASVSTSLVLTAIPVSSKLKVRDGGTWKEAKAVYVRDGGTWKEAKAIYARDSGTWKESK